MREKPSATHATHFRINVNCSYSKQLNSARCFRIVCLFVLAYLYTYFVDIYSFEQTKYTLFIINPVQCSNYLENTMSKRNLLIPHVITQCHFRKQLKDTHKYS